MNDNLERQVSRSSFDSTIITNGTQVEGKWSLLEGGLACGERTEQEAKSNLYIGDLYRQVNTVVIVTQFLLLETGKKECLLT